MLSPDRAAATLPGETDMDEPENTLDPWLPPGFIPNGSFVPPARELGYEGGRLSQ